MRKILMMFMLALTVSVLLPSEVKAQVYSYRTTGYAFKKVNSYGNWTNWSDWQDSNMNMTIDFNTDIITIYSPTKQTYYIKEHIRDFVDNSGGKQIEFAAVDQDGDRCHIRLRVETNGNSQIYVEFNNIILCWNVRRVY